MNEEQAAVFAQWVSTKREKVLTISFVVVFFLCAIGLSFFLGRHTAKPRIVWFSDLATFTGKTQYLIDADVKCPNGKDLGRLQVDLNLTNGKIRIVRNDPGEYPSCAGAGSTLSPPK
jgi:hypothetical protein